MWKTSSRAMECRAARHRQKSSDSLFLILVLLVRWVNMGVAGGKYMKILLRVPGCGGGISLSCALPHSMMGKSTLT